MFRRRILVTTVALPIIISTLTLTASAATPSDGEPIEVQESGTAQRFWEGTVNPSAGGPFVCVGGANADVYHQEVIIPDEIQTQLDAGEIDGYIEVRIDWTPTPPSSVAFQDLALVVVTPSGQQADSDGGAPREAVSFDFIEEGEYDVYACGFAVVLPQPYIGEFILTTSPAAEQVPNPPSTPTDVSFGPITISDPQRDIAEPNLEIDLDAGEYTCGPFGASRDADYASKSEDRGDTFRVMGLPPEGRMAPGGGGDCEMAVGTERLGGDGAYNVAYTGLAALINFSTGRSPDGGHSWTGTNVSESPVVVDRQWMDAVGERTVWLTYRQIPIGSFVQTSTDGGLTYSVLGTHAIEDISVSGNILVDNRTIQYGDADPISLRPAEGAHTLYIIHTFGNEVRVAFSHDGEHGPWEIMTVMSACDEVPEGTPGTECISGDPSSIFPSLAQDASGRLYAAWTEAGSYNTYYSTCFPEEQGDCLYPMTPVAPEEGADLVEPAGAQWSPKVQVNRDDVFSTNMPWVTAGDEGRIAISFYGSTVDGNPEVGSFRGPWDVYVNTIFDADDVDPDDPNSVAVGQTAVTTHPIHWDSICLSGLACSATGGDRTLLDFFQLARDPEGRIRVAYNESNKRYGDAVGPIAIMTYSKQFSGPDLIGAAETPDPRPVVDVSRTDPAEDAVFPFSWFPGPRPAAQNHPALDLLSLSSETRTVEGDAVVTFTMQLTDLSDAAIIDAQTALLPVPLGTNLLYVARFFSGFEPHAAVASVDATGTWICGYTDLAMTPDAKLEIYPPSEEIACEVDQEAGTITLDVPYSLIEHVTVNPADPAAEPEIRTVEAGDRIYELTAFTFGNLTGDPFVQAFLNQGDSTPPYDFILEAELGPAPTASPTVPPAAPTASPTAPPTGPGGGGRPSPTPTRNPLPNTSQPGGTPWLPAVLASAVLVIAGGIGLAAPQLAARRRQQR